MKVLILCNKSPYPPKEGGPMAINMLVEGLIEAGHQVKVLAMNTNKYSVDSSKIPENYRRNSGIEFIEVDLSIRPWKALLNLFTNRSYHVERFISAAYAKRVEELLTTDSYDVVQFEMPYMSPYLPLVQKLSKATTILRAHNIEHKIWERIAETTPTFLKRIYLRHLTHTLKKHEIHFLTQVDGVAAISEVDADFFRKVMKEHSLHDSNNSPNVISIPFGIDPSRYPSSELKKPLTLFSIGAMNWIPNAEGIRWFLEQVWPTLHQHFPTLKFHIAGRAMPGWMLALQLPNVLIEGEVSDAIHFISDHAIMVVPLFSGSGIRIKIIEGMACGKAIVSTSVGAEGIHYHHGKDILIGDTAEAFIQHITTCLQDENLASNLGKNARRRIETEYAQKQIIQRLVGFYQKTGS